MNEKEFRDRLNQFMLRFPANKKYEKLEDFNIFVEEFIQFCESSVPPFYFTKELKQGFMQSLIDSYLKIQGAPKYES